MKLRLCFDCNEVEAFDLYLGACRAFDLNTSARGVNGEVADPVGGCVDSSTAPLLDQDGLERCERMGMSVDFGRAGAGDDDDEYVSLLDDVFWRPFIRGPGKESDVEILAGERFDRASPRRGRRELETRRRALIGSHSPEST